MTRQKNLPSDKSVLYTITTNGTLLTEDLIEYFAQNNVCIVLSLDGPQKIHDSSRIFLDNSGSYNQTYQALIMINQVLKRMNIKDRYQGIINCTITGGYSYRDLFDYFTGQEYLLNTNYVHFSLQLNGIRGGINQWNEYYPDDPLEAPTEFQELLEEYKIACLEGIYQQENDREWKWEVLHQIVGLACYFQVHGRTRHQIPGEEEILELSHPGAICKVGARRPFLRSDGKYLPCERVNYSENSLFIGDYKTGICTDKCLSIIDNFTNATKEYFRDCWCYRMCSVPCISTYIVDGKLNPSLKLKSCKSLRKKRHQELIGMMEMIEKNPDSLIHFNRIHTQ